MPRCSLLILDLEMTYEQGTMLNRDVAVQNRINLASDRLGYTS
jgi:hypothetical protein